jgi:hypothetical protein
MKIHKIEVEQVKNVNREQIMIISAVEPGLTMKLFLYQKIK